jgi:large subunit ribosomal protein LP0
VRFDLVFIYLIFFLFFVKIPYYLKDGFKNLVAITQATSYTFPLAAKFADAAKNVVVVAAAPVAAAPAAPVAPTTAPKEEPKKEEKKEEEEEDFDMGGLFD